MDDLFKIGIGPSSSHTVGPMRAARAFVDELAGLPGRPRPHRVSVRLLGALGATGVGHGTPDAVIAGLRGWRSEDCDPLLVRGQWDRLAEDPWVRSPAGPLLLRPEDVRLDPKDRSAGHPNAIDIAAYDGDGRPLLLRRYLSVGGGTVLMEGEHQAGSRRAIPWHFGSFVELVEICERHSMTIDEVVRQNEEARGRRPDDHLVRVWGVMNAAIERGASASDSILPGSLALRRRAPRLTAAVTGGAPVAVSELSRLHAAAMAVSEENAAGRRVATAPTNGAAGIIPAVVDFYLRSAGAGAQGAVGMLLTASAIGAIVKAGASVSGAEIGCQGEVGTACAMAAGALCSALGGTPAQVGKAAEIGIEHHLGLTCDPVAGLVQVPCIERNAIAAVTAVQAAMLTLAEGEPRNRVSLDTAVTTMAQVGADMHAKYKETSLGGLAANVPVC